MDFRGHTERVTLVGTPAPVPLLQECMCVHRPYEWYNDNVYISASGFPEALFVCCYECDLKPLEW